MAQISVGKLLPNLKVTLGNETTEVEKSFECSEKPVAKSDDDSNVEIVRSWMESLQSPKIYKNKSGGFTTGLDLISEENTEILGKRAERFGLEKEETSVAPNINSLYENMGITIDNRNSAKMKNMRLDALHMRGVNDLNTNDIFHYFKDYGPASVEWINDFSCNVVWLDETSCARALLGVTKSLSNCKSNTVEETTHSDLNEPSKSSTLNQELSTTELDDSKGEVTMDVDDDLQIKSGSSESSLSLDIPVPPGCWRMGVPHPKAKSILLRFATKDDIKLPGAEKRSDFYKKYGNPNYGGLKGLISSSRKRKMQAASTKRAIEVGSSQSIKLQSTDSPISDVPIQKVSHPKPPRMRMYADDEEQKTIKLRSRELLRSADKPASVHSRLGTKYTKDDLCHLGSYRRSPVRNHFAFDDDTEREDTRRSTQWERKRNWTSETHADLRTKIKKLRTTKHRSPLCVDSESASEE